MSANGRRQLAGRLDRLEQLLAASSSPYARLWNIYEGMSDEERDAHLTRTLAILTRALGREGVREMLREKGIPEATLDKLEPLFEEAEGAG